MAMMAFCPFFPHRASLVAVLIVGPAKNGIWTRDEFKQGVKKIWRQSLKKN
jgi:hypothetical protein